MTQEQSTLPTGLDRECWYCKSDVQLSEQDGHWVCVLCRNEPGRAEQRRLEEQKAEENYFWMTWVDDDEDDPDGRKWDTGEYGYDGDYFPEDDEDEEETEA